MVQQLSFVDELKCARCLQFQDHPVIDDQVCPKDPDHRAAE